MSLCPPPESPSRAVAPLRADPAAAAALATLVAEPGRPHAPVAAAESPDHDVALVAWPEEAARRAELAAVGRPRLLMVAPEAAPPITWDHLEDWVRVPVDPRELDARRGALAHRRGAGQPLLELDGDGIVRTGDRWVAIPPVEARVLAALLHRRGEVVPRSSLVAAGWPHGTSDPRILDGRIKLLRRRLARLGVRIHTVRGVGFVLDPLVTPWAV